MRATGSCGAFRCLGGVVEGCVGCAVCAGALAELSRRLVSAYQRLTVMRNIRSKRFVVPLASLKLPQRIVSSAFLHMQWYLISSLSSIYISHLSPDLAQLLGWHPSFNAKYRETIHAI